MTREMMRNPRTAETLPVHRQTSRATCLAVMYHYVREGGCGARRGVKGLDRRTFADQLDALSREFEPVRWLDLWRWMQGEGEIPPQSFLLTFDDGLKEHLEVVAPELESRGIRGVFFAATRTLCDRQPLSAHLLHALLDRLEVEPLAERLTVAANLRPSGLCGLSMDQIASADRIYHYEIAPTRYVKYLVNYVLSVPDRYRVLQQCYADNIGSIEEFVRHWYLSPEDALELHRRGHTLGGHGHSHEPLGTLEPAEQLADLRRCHEWIEPMTRESAIPVSFPFGSFDAGTLERCQTAGFAGAFTTRSARIRFSTDCYQLPRIDTIHVDAEIGRPPC